MMRSRCKVPNVYLRSKRRQLDMRIPRSLGFALSALAAVAMLAGCSGAVQTPLVPNQTQSQQSVARQSMNAAASAASTLAVIRSPGADLSVSPDQNGAMPSGGLYVAEAGARSVPVIREYALPDIKNGPPKCKDILSSSGVYGIGVNARRVLYVPLIGTYGKPHKILTFGPYCGASGPTLIDPYTPIDVAFDNTANNTVYVADVDTSGIDVYEKGATSPTRTLSNSALRHAVGVAVDGSGNVFQTGVDTSNIAEYPRGQQQGSRVLGVTGLDRPGGLEFDVKGNLIVIDSYSGILVYAPPFNGPPIRTIRTKGSPLYGKLDFANRNLYVSDSSFGENHPVDVYAYPSGTFEYSITNGLTKYGSTGVAVDPASPN